MNLESIFFAEMTFGRIVWWAALVFACLGTLKLVKRVFSRPRTTTLQHTVYFSCRNCGWQGQVSKYGTNCPKCNHTMN